MVTHIALLYDRFLRAIRPPSRSEAITALMLAIVMPLAGKPERIQLSRDDLHIEILVDDPRMLDEFGPRFDRLGYIRELRLKDASLLGPWGLPDEFGLSGVGVLEYKDTPVGENFVKIGVGALQRTSTKTYFFSERYPMKECFPIEIVEHTENSLRVAQKARPQGIPWHYDYMKTYSIEGNRLHISYSLTNKGKQPFTFEHYNHHWFTLMAGTVGPNHIIETAFPLIKPTVKSPYNFETYRLWPKAQIAPTKSLYYAVSLKNVPPAKNRVRLSAGVTSVMLQGNFSPSQFAVYAQNDTISPEVFFLADLPPGETVHWEMTYQFAPIEPADRP